MPYFIVNAEEVGCTYVKASKGQERDRECISGLRAVCVVCSLCVCVYMCLCFPPVSVFYARTGVGVGVGVCVCVSAWELACIHTYIHVHLSVKKQSM